MSGAQLTTPASRLSALNAAAAWKASCVNLNSTSAGWTPALISALSTKKWDGEFCASTIVFPRRSAIVLTVSRTTIPSPPVDLLVHSRHDAGVLPESLEKERQHIEGGPADMQIPGGEGVAHGDRVVNQ